MFRSSAAVRPPGLAGGAGSERRPLSRRQFVSLASAAGLAVVLLVVAEIVPLPGLVERWWQALVPGSPSPASRLSLPAYPGVFPDGVGESRADAGLQRFAGSSIMRPTRAHGSTDRPRAKRRAVRTPIVAPTITTAPGTAPVPTVSPDGVSAPTTTRAENVLVLTAPLPTTPAVTTPAVTTPAVTTPVLTTPAVTTPVGTLPAVTTPVATTPGVAVPSVTVPKLPGLP
jgi:hypothetical protein